MVKTGIKLLIFCVEVVKSERKIRGELGHVVQNFRLPLVNLNLSIVTVLTSVQPISNSVCMDA